MDARSQKSRFRYGEKPIQGALRLLTVSKQQAGLTVSLHCREGGKGRTAARFATDDGSEGLQSIQARDKGNAGSMMSWCTYRLGSPESSASSYTQTCVEGWITCHTA